VHLPIGSMEQSPSEKLTGSQLVKKFPHFMEPLCLPPVPILSPYQWINPGLRHQFIFRNMIQFYGEELFAPHPTAKLEYHPLSAVRVCLFNIFTATLHIGGRSSIHNLRTCHWVVICTHLSWLYCIPWWIYWSGWLSRYSDWLRSGQSGGRIPVGAKFFATVQTGPGAHQASCTVGTGSSPGVNYGWGVCADHSPTSSVVVMEE
jgi:hypothetical protein